MVGRCRTIILFRMVQKDLIEKSTEKGRKRSHDSAFYLGKRRVPGRGNTGAKALRWECPWHV